MTRWRLAEKLLSGINNSKTFSCKSVVIVLPDLPWAGILIPCQNYTYSFFSMLSVHDRKLGQDLWDKKKTSYTLAEKAGQEWWQKDNLTGVKLWGKLYFCKIGNNRFSTTWLWVVYMCILFLFYVRCVIVLVTTACFRKELNTSYSNKIFICNGTSLFFNGSRKIWNVSEGYDICIMYQNIYSG